MQNGHAPLDCILPVRRTIGVVHQFKMNITAARVHNHSPWIVVLRETFDLEGQGIQARMNISIPHALGMRELHARFRITKIAQPLNNHHMRHYHFSFDRRIDGGCMPIRLTPLILCFLNAAKNSLAYCRASSGDGRLKGNGAIGNSAITKCFPRVTRTAVSAPRSSLLQARTRYRSTSALETFPHQPMIYFLTTRNCASSFRVSCVLNRRTYLSFCIEYLFHSTISSPPGSSNVSSRPSPACRPPGWVAHQ